MSEHLPQDSIEYFLGSMWAHKPPRKIAFQIICSADFNNRAIAQGSFDVLMRGLIEADIGRLAYVCYGTEFKLPSGAMGPLIIDQHGKPIVLTTLDQTTIPAGNYVIIATDATDNAYLSRLQIARALICATFGKAGAHYVMYEAAIEFGEEQKLSFSTNAFENPQEGFWSAFTDIADATSLVNVFVGAYANSAAQAAVSIFSAAFEQRDLSAKHILYWSALETLTGAKRLANALGAIYGCAPHQLDTLIPFSNLRDGRDGAAHHGKASNLTQKHERIIFGMFTDILAFTVQGSKTRFAPKLAAGLSD